MIPAIGSPHYLAPYWVEVVGFTPRHRFVRYRKIGRSEVERLSLARWKAQAREG